MTIDGVVEERDDAQDGRKDGDFNVDNIEAWQARSETSSVLLFEGFAIRVRVCRRSFGHRV
jgi:hypothetical protein